MKRNSNAVIAPLAVPAITMLPSARHCHGSKMITPSSETTKARPVAKTSHPKNALRPFHDFFQMLFGLSSINSIFYRGSRREPAHYFQMERTHVRCYVIKISARSLRGRGTKDFDR